MVICIGVIIVDKIHSIVIDDSGDASDTIPVNEDGTVIINAMKFNSNINCITDAISKASYVYLYIRDWSNDRRDEFIEIFNDLIKEHVGAIDVIFDDTSTKGFIKHQMVRDDDLNYLFDNTELLRQFIFNPKSTLSSTSLEK